MSESYLVIFNSRSSNAVDATNRNKVIFDVNWETFLPKTFTSFKCQFTFKSESIAGALSDVGFVGINLGKMNVFDGNAQSNNLGIIYPVIIGTNSFYSTTISDNLDFIINYPSQRQVTITLNEFDNTTAILTMPHYCLYLSLNGIV